jgi:hypothetical protein
MGRHAPAPTAQQQLDFLVKIERLLAKGRRTTTYKFALLIALTNLAVEQGDDSGDALEISVDDIARQFLSLYWNMARLHPRLNSILKQSTNETEPARMITLLADQASRSESSYLRLRVYREQRDELLSEARLVLARNPLHRLQVIGGSAAIDPDLGRFLYDHPRTEQESMTLDVLTLKPGVAACLRKLRGVILSIAEARWTQWVRENNERLGADHNLEEFLFVPRRRSVSSLAPRFYEIQDGRCFYTDDKLRDPRDGEVDHFIPWARYPFDSPFNLVLASRAVNNKLRDDLKKPEWRTKWLARNERHRARLIAPEPDGFGAAAEDEATARAISDWIYRTTA